jgi:hypothetical protein
MIFRPANVRKECFQSVPQKWSPRHDSDLGAALLGVLLTLLILGGLAAGLLISLPTTTSSGPNANPGSASVASLPGGATPALGNDITAASAVACRANFAAAQTAVGLYHAERGALPTTIGEVQPLLRDPLSTNRFTITIDPSHPGLLEVATPGHPAVDGNANCAYAG